MCITITQRAHSLVLVLVFVFFVLSCLVWSSLCLLSCLLRLCLCPVHVPFTPDVVSSSTKHIMQRGCYASKMILSYSHLQPTHRPTHLSCLVRKEHAMIIFCSGRGAEEQGRQKGDFLHQGGRESHPQREREKE
jgi:hypothetical protein